MALLNYFKFKDKKASGMPLPDPQGWLSKEINSATVKELNMAVESLVKLQSNVQEIALELSTPFAIFPLIFLKVHLRKARSVGGRKHTCLNCIHDEGPAKTC